MGEEWISAGDIEKFGYCPLSWWLSLEEEEVLNESLERGVKEHEKMGEALEEVKIKEEESGKVENMVLWLAVAATILSIGGFTLLRPEGYFRQILLITSLIWLLAATFFLYMSETNLLKDSVRKVEKIVLTFAMIATILTFFAFTIGLTDPQIARITQLVSLSWLVGASYWLKISLSLQKDAEYKRSEYKVSEGDIEYVDKLDKKTNMLRSQKYKIRGRPDYIIKKNGDQIPIEVKSGRVPKGPFFSHVLQSAAYCMLIEEDLGSRPPYGIVKYGDNEFKIDYDDDLKDLLINKTEEMRGFLETGEVHRNHNRPGKCANCSRRELCKESLV